jgi:hypothetical protein
VRERIVQLRSDIVTVLGGIHRTFMYLQVLEEAPWIDAVVRGIADAGDHVVATPAASDTRPGGGATISRTGDCRR